MTIKSLLTGRFRRAMTAAGIPENCQPHIAASTRPEFGDFQANGAMGAAKALRASPGELARAILDNLALDDVAEKVEIAGPGFINIHLASRFIAGQLCNPPQSGHNQPQTIVVDYSSPNLAKEMHVGHLRSTIIGDAVARVLEHAGHRVIRQNHMGDWGTQFGMLIAELEEHLGEGEKPELALRDLEGFYQQSKQHFDSDAAFAGKARDYVVKLQSGDAHCQALWRQFIAVSTAHSEEIYSALNVTLKAEDIKPESAYNDDLQQVVDALGRRGLAVEDNGARVVFLDELADRKGNPSPVIVQKSGGGFLYATTDLAALKYRSQTLKADRVLYFVDARQSLHMKQVFTVARKAGLVTENISLEHHPFGTMMGQDGKPFKTRAGGAVKLAGLLTEAVTRAAELIREKQTELTPEEQLEVARKVGIGAVKYADLSKARANDYIFNWDAMLSFEGNTAPYLQYAYTRIRSIFRKAGLTPEQVDGSIDLTTPEEKALALKLLLFPEVLEQVAAAALPHLLCNYLYDLASAYMTFYERCPVLKSDTPETLRNSRLRLCGLTAGAIATGLDLLGIEVMEKM